MIRAEADGDRYMEACRMVRKDGFFRIAQNLRQEGFNAFPAGYLEEDAEVEEYSDYVTTAVSAYELATDPDNNPSPTNPYEAAPPTLTSAPDMSPLLVFPASTAINPTEMTDATGITEQQLRSRGGVGAGNHPVLRCSAHLVVTLERVAGE